MSERTYSVPGVSCAHCQHAISTEVRRVPGVSAVDVDLQRKVVVVGGDRFDETAVRAAIDDAGYDVVEASA